MKVVIVDDTPMIRIGLAKWLLEDCADVKLVKAFRFSKMLRPETTEQLKADDPEIFAFFIPKIIKHEIKVLKTVAYHFPRSRILIVSPDAPIWRLPPITLGAVSIFTESPLNTDNFCRLLKALILLPIGDGLQLMADESTKQPLRIEHIGAVLKGVFQELDYEQKILFRDFCHDLYVYIVDPSAKLSEADVDAWNTLLDLFEMTSRIALAFLFMVVDSGFTWLDDQAAK